MANPTNPTNPGSGSHGRPNPKPQQPKTIIRAYPEVSVGLNDTYTLRVDVSAFLGGQPMANQEVTLKEGIHVLDTQVLDVNGETLLRAGGKLSAVEQVNTIRVCFTGLPEEKILTVTIPAIKKTVLKPKAITVIPANFAMDQTAGTYSVSFQVTVLEDGHPWTGGHVSLKEGIGQLADNPTDNNGQVTFNVTGILGKTEKNVTYRISLVGLADSVEQNLTVPAADLPKKVDNDPETISLRRHHDGAGNFKVYIRVLKAGGNGVATKVKVWYGGTLTPIDTDNEGDAVFTVPGVVAPGTHEHLVATVSGIADEASLDIKRRKNACTVTAFSPTWWLGTNNGRAFILLMAVILTWIITFIVGPGEPKINPNMFNHRDSELSSAEQFYNESAKIADDTYVVQPHGDWSTGRIAFWGWLLIITILVLIYNIFAWREEITAWVEDKLDKAFDKSHSKAGDPTFEMLAKMLGSYRVAKKTPKVVMNVNNTVVNPDGSTPSPAPATAAADSGHPSLRTLFSLDLMSDAIVATITGILRKLKIV